MNTRVKICGVTSVADAALAVRCGADLIGLNFYPLSPRYVSLPIAREIRAVIPERVWCVGVFVNTARECITQFVEQLALHAIQFHGDEKEADLQGWSCTTIKALRVRPDEPLPKWEQCSTDYLLLDTHIPGRYGGTGEAFPWECASALPPQGVSRQS